MRASLFDLSREFDAARGLAATGAGGIHVLLMTMHHIASDGWSIGGFSTVSCRFCTARIPRGRFLPCLNPSFNMLISAIGSSAGCRGRRSNGNLITGSGNLPARPRCWNCRWTIRVRPARRIVAARGGNSRSTKKRSSNSRCIVSGGRLHLVQRVCWAAFKAVVCTGTRGRPTWWSARPSPDGTGRRSRG